MLQYGTLVPTQQGLYPLDPQIRILKGGTTTDPSSILGAEGGVVSASYQVCHPIGLRLLCGKDLLVLTPKGYMTIDEAFNSGTRVTLETKGNLNTRTVMQIPGRRIRHLDRLTGRAVGWFWITYPLTGASPRLKKYRSGIPWRDIDRAVISTDLLYGMDVKSLRSIAMFLGLGRADEQKPLERLPPVMSLTTLGPDFLVGFLEGYCRLSERYTRADGEAPSGYQLNFPLFAMAERIRVLFILLGVFPGHIKSRNKLPEGRWALGFSATGLEKLRAMAFGTLPSQTGLSLQGSVKHEETVGIRKKYRAPLARGRLYYQPLNTSWFGLSI